jgi:hypothetical protein
MLQLFEVTGFKNFENPVSLDFSDVHDYKFNDNCIHNNLLNKIIIYGKNAVGKTNLGLALFDIVTHLTSNNVSPNLYDYYLNINNEVGYAKFHYVFLFGNDKVDYCYSKDEKQTLLYESVTINNEKPLVWSLDNDHHQILGFREYFPTLNFDFNRDDSLLKYAITNSNLAENHPLYQMYNFVTHMLWFRSLDENRYIGYTSESKDFFSFIFEETAKHELEELLHQAGIRENLIVKVAPDGKKRLYFDTKTPLPFFSAASSGTKALYTFFYWYKKAAAVSFMFLDEFDAFYHYELAETIINLLEEKPNFQTIVTSHNTNLLTNRIMRPDCYFILTPEKLTSFVNATNRELREGHNLEKLYKSGEFGE